MGSKTATGGYLEFLLSNFDKQEWENVSYPFFIDMIIFTVVHWPSFRRDKEAFQWALYEMEEENDFSSFYTKQKSQYFNKKLERYYVDILT